MARRHGVTDREEGRFSKLESATFDPARQSHREQWLTGEQLMILRYRNAYRFLAALSILAVASCRTAGDPAIDPRACYQTYEFGNTGCLEITGQVVDANGQPLKDIPLFGRAVPDTAGIGFANATTSDVSGKFRMRAIRMLGQPTSHRDSVRVYVGALWRPTLRRDSVFVTATIAPVGEIPDAVDVRIVLQIP